MCMSAGRPEGTKLPRGVSPAFHSAGNRALSGVLGSGDKIAESLLTACGVFMAVRIEYFNQFKKRIEDSEERRENDDD